MPRFRAYAELARISNLPTTFTNVLVGAAAATSVRQDAFDHQELWVHILIAWLAVACFYIAGMAMNDFCDAAIDRIERPHRPIPSGRISPTSARNFVIALMVIGLALLGSLGIKAVIAGAILVLLIIAYNLLHTRSAVSVILLGLSRGMVYVVGTIAISDLIEWRRLQVLAGAITLYTIAFSLIARREMKPRIGGLGWIAELAVFVAIVPPFFLSTSNWEAIILPLLLAAIWLSRGVGMVMAEPPSTKRAVMTWISGICLIDGLYLAMLEQPVWWIIANACFIITTLAQRRIAGT